jgi:hypothetical protein
MTLLFKSEAWGKMIHGKNMKQKNLVTVALKRLPPPPDQQGNIKNMTLVTWPADQLLFYMK